MGGACCIWASLRAEANSPFHPPCVFREEPGMAGRFVEMELPGIVWAGPLRWRLVQDELPGRGRFAAVGPECHV